MGRPRSDAANYVLIPCHFWADGCRGIRTWRCAVWYQILAGRTVRRLILWGLAAVLVADVVVLGVKWRSSRRWDARAAGAERQIATWCAAQGASPPGHISTMRITVGEGDWLALVEPYSNAPVFSDTPADANISRLLQERASDIGKRPVIVVISGGAIKGVCQITVTGPPIIGDGDTRVWKIHEGTAVLSGRLDATGPWKAFRLIDH
jgi:hypothetical protein